MNAVRDRLVVSVHDVCPRTWAATQQILLALDSLGVRRRSLLVIPAEPGGATDECPRFARWLQFRQGEGDEMVLHGYYHGRPPAGPIPDPPLSPLGKGGSVAGGDLQHSPPYQGGAGGGPGTGPPRQDRLAGLLDAALARGAGEFLHLDHAAAAVRLAAGRERLARCGLQADGFVAPAWLYSPAAAQAVADAGFRYLTTHLRLRDLRDGVDLWSFGTSNRPGTWCWDYVGRGVNEGFCWLHRPLPLIRIGIHPADLDHARPFRHTLSLLRRLLAAGRRPVAYRDCLAP